MAASRAAGGVQLPSSYASATARARWRPDSSGPRDGAGGGQGATSTTISTSTGASSGSTATPTATAGVDARRRRTTSAEQLAGAVDHAGLTGEVRGAGDEADDLDDPDDLVEVADRSASTAASALSAQIAASSLAVARGDLGADLAGRGQRAVDHRQLARGVDVRRRCARRARTPRPAAATSGSVRPSSARRSSAALMTALRALQVGDELLGVRAGHDLDELPAVDAPGVEDLLGRVDEQRHGGVLPRSVMRRP